MNIKMTTGQKIQAYRKNLEMTQEQLAEAVRRECGTKTNRSTIARWESGTQPDVESIVAMARIFDTTIDFLNSTEPIKILTPKQKFLIDIILHSEDSKLNAIIDILKTIDRRESEIVSSLERGGANA